MKKADARPSAVRWFLPENRKWFVGTLYIYQDAKDAETLLIHNWARMPPNNTTYLPENRHEGDEERQYSFNIPSLLNGEDFFPRGDIRPSTEQCRREAPCGISYPPSF